MRTTSGRQEQRCPVLISPAPSLAQGAPAQGRATEDRPGRDRPTAADADLAAHSLRSPLTKERYYFVMADRFANADKHNDRGGLTGGQLQTGFDPTHKGFYHGGDLKGITSKLDYIKGLGTTAIWLTPSFKNKPVQGGPGQESAGYHGYWITDFTQIDPHLGTNAEMKALIAAAHRKGMKVFFDIITNHTADVIDYEEKQYTYRDKTAYPYRDAAGVPFDDRDYATSSTFPTLDPQRSFPYTPVFPTPADATVKVPAWLNDPTMYHNRGDSTFEGESSEYGDFVGLDDLFTERPEVVKGMGEIYKAWVDLGIDGFRIDTVKHVNLEFWQQFIPDLLDHARARGNDDFFAFGEIYDSRPEYLSRFTTTGRLQAALDFGFQQEGIAWAQGKSGDTLRDFFAKDDYYTDADSNAYQLPTFLGNHDMGRAAMFLREGSADEAEHLRRVKLAQSLMFFTRGQPVTYYGDEQGFVGTGNDQAARHDMFASKVDLYNSEQVLGGPEGSRDRYDRHHPLYQHIAALSRTRDRHPALADGTQIHRQSASGTGVFAVSRLDRRDQVEYIVAANNSRSPATSSFEIWTSNARFSPIGAQGNVIRSNANGQVTVTVPPQSVTVWRATQRIDRPDAAPDPTLTVGPTDPDRRREVRATLAEDTFAEATFLYRVKGAREWQRLGTDDNAAYRVFHDVSGMPRGTVIEYRAVVRDIEGQLGAASRLSVVR